MPGVRQSLSRDSCRGRGRATKFRASVGLRHERATSPQLLRGHRGGGSSLRAHHVRMPGGLKRATLPPRVCLGRRPDTEPHIVAENCVRVARSRPTQHGEEEQEEEEEEEEERTQALRLSRRTPREAESDAGLMRKQRTEATRERNPLLSRRRRRSPLAESGQRAVVECNSGRSPSCGASSEWWSKTRAPSSKNFSVLWIGQTSGLHEDRRVVERGAPSPGGPQVPLPDRPARHRTSTESWALEATKDVEAPWSGAPRSSCSSEGSRNKTAASKRSSVRPQRGPPCASPRRARPPTWRPQCPSRGREIRRGR